jgi:hypothetical protein
VSADLSCSENELLVAFDRAAQAWGSFFEAGPADTANRYFDEMAETYRALKAMGREAVAGLLGLLHSNDPHVVLSAASVLLEMFPEAAEPVLMDLSSRPGTLGFTAKMTLREFHAGRMGFP